MSRLIPLAARATGRFRLLLASCVGLIALLPQGGASETPPPVSASAKSLFDGKTLNGWEGDPKLWRVEDGTITGGSLTQMITQNEFLASTSDHANFVIRFKIKLEGTEGFVNSGFQIRSQRDPGSSEMIGYQCDFGEPDWYGSIYDETRRNRVMAKSDIHLLRRVIKKGDWNDYVIRAIGPRITTWINGVVGVDYIEGDLNLVQHGKFGIQVHGGGKALVRVKDILIEELPLPTTPEGAPAPAKPAKEAPLSPDEEHAAFSIAPGLEMELVVSEDIDHGYGKFVAVQFDARGHLWTMTALEYPVDGNESPEAAAALYASRAKDKILVYDIVDRGQDGTPPRYAKEPTIFADGLAIPLGILPYQDGCYAQHGEDIVFLRDTDGDGRADKRDVILTGFGVQDSHLFPHQFTRAPGGWLWMAQGAFNYSNVTGPLLPEPVKFDQTRMAKFRPDGSQFTITSNGPCNIWGLVINGEGEAFIQEANDFGYPVMPFHEYANYPGCSNAQWKTYAPEFPGTAPDFRLGGTGLSGLALTDWEGAFPPEWSDVMLVANPITSRIQAIKMHRSSATGTGWVLEKRPDVVVSGDEWFRPVGLTLGPDGCVYIVDWYNKIISHNEVPRNHPERDKKRGRIWRLKGKGRPAYHVPDFATLPEKELVSRLGGKSLTQSHLAWQTLEDRGALSPETIALLKERASSASASPYPDAALIQALWATAHLGLPEGVLVEAMAHPSRNVRREALRLLKATHHRAVDLIRQGLSDPDAEVRAEAIRTAAALLRNDSPAASENTTYLTLLLTAVPPPSSDPTAPSTQHGRPIKTGAAYEREFARYLVRLFLEEYPGTVAAFLDRDAAASLPPESLMLASLSLPPKDSAPRVARLLEKLGRVPNDEEILRLAEAPEDATVQKALAALVARPEGLAALLRQQARFDSRALIPLLTQAARDLLATDPALGLKVASAFKLTSLEPAIAALAERQPTPTAVLALRDLGSTRASLFTTLAASPDAALRDAALAALTATPEQLLPFWPEMNATQRRRSLDTLANTKPGAQALIAAVNADRIGRDELDGALVDKLQAVLGAEDPALQALMDSMAGLFREVLLLDGQNESFVDTNLTLDGPFTVETWIKLEPGIGNEDGLLGAPGVLDINFYDARLRVWAGGGRHDLIVANKAVVPGVWTHVAVTRDEEGFFKIYLNGELDQAEGKPDRSRYEGLAIGRSNVKRGTAATFAEYRIWSTCRSAFNIRAEFDRTGLASTPVFYRPLDAPWEGLRGGARRFRTMDFPTLVTPGAARALDEKFSQYRALARRPGGDPERGKVAAAVCTACHKIRGEGAQIGPDLSSVGAMGLESILRNILTPNAAMEPGYRVFRAELTDGSLREGFLAAEDEQAIVLRVPGVDDQRVPRDQIRKARFTRQSLMPEGLEATFSPEQWTDLMAYLLSLK